MTNEERRREAREYFADLPEDARRAVLEATKRKITEAARADGLPVEEVLTDDLVETVAVNFCEKVLADTESVMREFFTGEELWGLLEELRAEGVSDDEMTAALTERVKAKYPHLFRRGRR